MSRKFQTQRYLTFSVVTTNLQLIRSNYLEILDHIGKEQLDELVGAHLYVLWDTIHLKDGHPDHWDLVKEDLENFNKQFV